MMGFFRIHTKLKNNNAPKSNFAQMEFLDGMSRLKARIDDEAKTDKKNREVAKDIVKVLAMNECTFSNVDNIFAHVKAELNRYQTTATIVLVGRSAD